MGKKTDKFIADLQKMGDACEGSITEMSQLAVQMDANGQQWDKYSGAYLTHFNRLYSQGIKDIAEMLKDAEFKRAYEPFHSVEVEREQVWTAGKKAKFKLGNDLSAMSRVISEFSRYIDKKSKSKNPFKSKKSLPAAKETLRVYEEFHRAAYGALEKLGRYFV